MELASILQYAHLLVTLILLLVTLLALRRARDAAHALREHQGRQFDRNLLFADLLRLDPRLPPLYPEGDEVELKARLEGIHLLIKQLREEGLEPLPAS